MGHSATRESMGLLNGGGQWLHNHGIHHHFREMGHLPPYRAQAFLNSHGIHHHFSGPSGRLGGDQQPWNEFTLSIESYIHVVYSVVSVGNLTMPHPIVLWLERPGRTLHLNKRCTEIDAEYVRATCTSWTSPETIGLAALVLISATQENCACWYVIKSDNTVVGYYASIQ